MPYHDSHSVSEYVPTYVVRKAFYRQGPARPTYVRTYVRKCLYVRTMCVRTYAGVTYVRTFVRQRRYVEIFSSRGLLGDDVGSLCLDLSTERRQCNIAEFCCVSKLRGLPRRKRGRSPGWPPEAFFRTNVGGRVRSVMRLPFQLPRKFVRKDEAFLSHMIRMRI